MVETEDDLIKRLNEWKDNMENKGMRVNMDKTKVMINGERQAVRWLCDVCSRGTHTTHNRFTAGLEYVRVHPGQQVPER